MAAIVLAFVPSGCYLVVQRCASSTHARLPPPFQHPTHCAAVLCDSVAHYLGFCVPFTTACDLDMPDIYPHTDLPFVGSSLEPSWVGLWTTFHCPPQPHHRLNPSSCNLALPKPYIPHTLAFPLFNTFPVGTVLLHALRSSPDLPPCHAVTCTSQGPPHTWQLPTHMPHLTASSSHLCHAHTIHVPTVALGLEPGLARAQRIPPLGRAGAMNSLALQSPGGSIMLYITSMPACGHAAHPVSLLADHIVALPHHWLTSQCVTVQQCLTFLGRHGQALGFH